MYVLDASVLVADARPSEPHHLEAHTLLVRLASEARTTLLPLIALAEVAAAISRGTGRPELARHLTVILRRMPHIRFIPVDEALADLAAELAAQHRIRGCDAIYVALAWRHDAILITLDREQRERAPSSITVRTPAEELQGDV